LASTRALTSPSASVTTTSYTAKSPLHSPKYNTLRQYLSILLPPGPTTRSPLGPFRPYVGGGAALARESAEAYGHSTTDWYGGLYVEGGARYFLVDGLAVEAGPRYTALFDEPVVYFDGLHKWDFVRSEHRSQLIELLIGVNYYF
jgi:opacity protein-like surface antigen